MTKKLIALTAALVLTVPAGAVAQTPVDAADLLARAAQYHGQVKPGPVHVMLDQPFLDALDRETTASLRAADSGAPDFHSAARALIGGDTIWVGAYWAGADPVYRCAVIVHEYGHLLGMQDDVRYERDPLNVMGSDAVPPQCQLLDKGYRVDSPRARLETAVFGARRQREECLAYAADRRPARRSGARRACWRKYAARVRAVSPRKGLLVQ